MSDVAVREQSEAVVTLLGRCMRRLFTMEADDPGMDMPIAQLRVCSVLIDGPKTMGSLSRELGITHSAITQIADRLERAGVVERVAEPDDRRCKSLRLTGSGRERMRSRRESRVLSVMQALGQLTAEDRDAVVNGLRMLFEAGAAVAPEGADRVSAERLVG